MQGWSLHNSQYWAWVSQAKARRKSSLRPVVFFLILRVDSKREGKGRDWEKDRSIEY